MVKGGCTCPEWEKGMAEKPPLFAYNWYEQKWKFRGERTDTGWRLCPFCRRRLTPPEEVTNDPNN